MFVLASREPLGAELLGLDPAPMLRLEMLKVKADLERELVSHASGANPRPTKVSAINSLPLSEGWV